MATTPEKLPPLIPYLTVQNAETAMAFYQNVCQFTLRDEPSKEDGKIIHAELRCGDAIVMLAPEGAWGSDKKSPKTTGFSPNIMLYVYVEDVDAHYQYAKDHGAVTITEPQDMFWGDRFYQLTDPDGYEWSFAKKLEAK